MLELVQALAAALTALVAVGALWFARGQVLEMRDSRREISQPYVVAYLEPIASNPDFVNLVVRNFGQTAAFDVALSATPGLTRSGDSGPQPVAVFEGLPILVPGQAWTTYFDTGLHRKGDAYPSRYEVTIRYRDSHGRDMSPSRCVLDWKSFEHRTWIVERDIGDVAKELRKLTDRFLHISNHQHLNVMADDAVHARRVARDHFRRTGQPVVNRSAAEELFDFIQLGRGARQHRSRATPPSRRLRLRSRRS